MTWNSQATIQRNDHIHSHKQVNVVLLVYTSNEMIKSFPLVPRCCTEFSLGGANGPNGYYTQ